MKLNKVSDTGLKITEISFGATAIASMPDTYGYSVSEEQAQKTLERFFKGPANMLDSSRIYGFGESENRIGRAIKKNGGWPNGFVMSTKLDRDLKTGRFDAAQARKSLEESLKALDLNHIDILHLHDPEHSNNISEITDKGGSIDELFKMKEEGIVKAVGLAMGRIDMMFPILKDWEFDILISHNRYTLLNRSANEMYDYAANKGIAIINAAPYAGGMLAKGSNNFSKITYQDVKDDDLLPVKEIEKLCNKFKIDMGAAALQFSLRDKRISTTLCGVSRPESIEKNLAWAKIEIPSDFWNELSKLPYSNEDPEANRVYKPS